MDINTAGGVINLELDSLESILRKRGLEAHGAAQKMLDSEVLRISSPYVPHLTGALEESGAIHTKIGSGVVVWKTPYARYQYYNNKGNKAPPRGSYWFQRAWNANGAQVIRKIAQVIGGTS